MRFSIEEYSQRFKMSKEMIHSRMRNKRLNYIIEDGITYIIVPRSSLDMESRREIHEEKKEQEKQIKEEKPAPSVTEQKPKKTTVGTIIALYQKENHQLKVRIKELETKIDKLIDDKERMLIEERNRIEQVYSNKDDQLKTILELINTKMLTSTPQTVHDVHLHDKEEVIEAYDASWQTSHLVELKKYMKTLDIASAERKMIKKRFTSGYGHDVRIIQQNGEFYLDFSKYDYSDLLNH